ncbi:sigma-54 dependent transcriptional regulator [Limibacter armeniacum]|uniref:sigma-54-dependent transcriptional regulator n=1 Tax=Limibacter armeniacum TaxID=466084 RepID=UPI002FE5E16D
MTNKTQNTNTRSILIIDDDINICQLMERFLQKKGFQTAAYSSGIEAQKALIHARYDLAMIDFRLPDGDGLELLRNLRKIQEDLKCIIMTGFSDVKLAVQSIKQGANDYVSKPIYPDEILASINSALTSAKNVETESPLHKNYIKGRSQDMERLMKHVDKVGPTDLSVLIEGETGSGKEYLARSIHDASNRRNQPFVAVDCGALTKELASSELFGHEKGAFTGAVRNHTGCFERANGGTIFLDEIGNLDYQVQVKLLRVIQERVFTKVGGQQSIEIDVRIIAATNEDLLQESHEGSFREDLYHRINEFSFHIPPLRERPDDIMHYAHFFLEQANKDVGSNVESFSEEVIRVFMAYPWPGNLRELRNVIRRATLLTEGKEIPKDVLPFEMTDSSAMASTLSDNIPGPDLKSATEHAEKIAIQNALKACDGNKSKAAELLKIDRKTLYNKLKEYDIGH